jgi:UDP-N-acetylglucosamine 3-dehydrogenase
MSRSELIRAAVIGVGGIGRHHARIYADMDGVELVAVADPDEVRRSGAAKRTGARPYADYHELLDKEKIDVVSVTVPTVLHHAVAVEAFARKLHVLVEKPITATVEDANDLIRIRQDTGLTLAVGHVERHNPAILELGRRLAQGELGGIFQVHSRRMSPMPAYIKDVGVTLDLATHEIDVMRSLVKSPLVRVYAETSKNVHATHEDTLVSTLRFANGVVGSLDVNWLTPSKIRECRITGERGMGVVDYIAQDLTFFENSSAPSRWDMMALFKGVEEGNVLKPRVAKAEPLREEILNFVHAARTGTPPRVTGTDGLFAVAIAQMLLESARENRRVDVKDEVIRRQWPSVLLTGQTS